MYVALDKNNNLVSIEEANKFKLYYCPSCKGRLIVKKGDIKIHHFAHKSKEECDNWDEMSVWHKDWQNQFDIKYREVSLGEHRADICIDNNTVVEFQNSYLNVQEWNKRIEFYSKNHNLIFLVNNHNKKNISLTKYCIMNETLKSDYTWTYPSKTIPNPINYHLFIELNDNRIVWVANKKTTTWDNFSGYMELTRKEFINIVLNINAGNLKTYEAIFKKCKNTNFFKNFEEEYGRRLKNKIASIRLKGFEKIKEINYAKQYIKNNQVKADIIQVNKKYHDDIKMLKIWYEEQLDKLEREYVNRFKVLGELKEDRIKELLKSEQEIKDMVVNYKTGIDTFLQLLDDVGIDKDPKEKKLSEEKKIIKKYKRTYK